MTSQRAEVWYTASLVMIQYVKNHPYFSQEPGKFSQLKSDMQKTCKRMTISSQVRELISGFRPHQSCYQLMHCLFYSFIKITKVMNINCHILNLWLNKKYLCKVMLMLLQWQQLMCCHYCSNSCFILAGTILVGVDFPSEQGEKPSGQAWIWLRIKVT